MIPQPNEQLPGHNLQLLDKLTAAAMGYQTCHLMDVIISPIKSKVLICGVSKFALPIDLRCR